MSPASTKTTRLDDLTRQRPSSFFRPKFEAILTHGVTSTRSPQLLPDGHHIQELCGQARNWQRNLFFWHESARQRHEPVEIFAWKLLVMDETKRRSRRCVLLARQGSQIPHPAKGSAYRGRTHMTCRNEGDVWRTYVRK